MNRIEEIKRRYKRAMHLETKKAERELLQSDVPWMIEQLEELERARELLSDFAEVYHSSGPPDEEWKAVLEEARNGPLSTVAYVEKEQAVLQALAKLVVQEREKGDVGYRYVLRFETALREAGVVLATPDGIQQLADERDRYKDAFEELVGQFRGDKGFRSIAEWNSFVDALEKKARGE